MNKIIVTLVGIGLLGTQSFAQQSSKAERKKKIQGVVEEIKPFADSIMVFEESKKWNKEYGEILAPEKIKFAKIKKLVEPKEFVDLKEYIEHYRKQILKRKEFNANLILQDILNIMEPYFDAYAKYGKKVYELNAEIIKDIPAGWGGTFSIIPFLEEHCNDTYSATQNAYYFDFKELLKEKPSSANIEKLSAEQEEVVRAFLANIYTPFINAQKAVKVENASHVLQYALSVYEAFLSEFAINVKEAEEYGAAVQAKDPAVVKVLMKKMNEPFVVGWTTTPIVLSDYLNKHLVEWYEGTSANMELGTFQMMLEDASK